MSNKTDIRWSKDVHLKMKELHLKSYNKSENIARCLEGKVCMVHINFLDEPIIDKIVGMRYRAERVVELTSGFYLIKYVQKIREISLEEQLLWKLKR